MCGGTILLKSLYQEPNRQGPIDLFYESKDTVIYLKDIISENNFNIEIQENIYAEEGGYSIYQNKKVRDILNYDDILATMQQLNIKTIIYCSLEGYLKLIPKDCTQESLVYRTSDPTEDEFGSWSELEPNWYYVFYPYT